MYIQQVRPTCNGNSSQRGAIRSQISSMSYCWSCLILCNTFYPIDCWMHVHSIEPIQKQTQIQHTNTNTNTRRIECSVTLLALSDVITYELQHFLSKWMLNGCTQHWTNTNTNTNQYKHIHILNIKNNLNFATIEVFSKLLKYFQNWSLRILYIVIEILRMHCFFNSSLFLSFHDEVCIYRQRCQSHSIEQTQIQGNTSRIQFNVILLVLCDSILNKLQWESELSDWRAIRWCNCTVQCNATQCAALELKHKIKEKDKYKYKVKEKFNYKQSDYAG